MRITPTTELNNRFRKLQVEMVATGLDLVIMAQHRWVRHVEPLEGSPERLSRLVVGDCGQLVRQRHFAEVDLELPRRRRDLGLPLSVEQNLHPGRVVGNGQFEVSRSDDQAEIEGEEGDHPSGSLGCAVDES